MKKKEIAIHLLVQKDVDPSITYDRIASQTGYSKRQLIRMHDRLNENGDTSVLIHHANERKEPVNKAHPLEIEFLRAFKVKYPLITIAQFRDIYLEDIIYDPAMNQIVEHYHLQKRSPSWFRNLFIQENRNSPEHRRPLRRDGRAIHPLRKPSPQRGALIQIDGTPYDWLNTKESWTLHLAVDDATSEPLAGYFMPTERQFGYCIIVKTILEKYGIPLALYSDKHTIFHSSREDHLTQFGTMMEDLGIELIHANGPQAKGRIERYNGTIQRRLPNDIIRFGISSYEELNVWFNDFYIPYINRKFAFTPLDPHDSFVPLAGYDIRHIFTLRYKRIINNDMFSFHSAYYCVLDDNGIPMHIRNGIEIDIRQDIFTNERYCLRYAKRHEIKLISKRDRRRNKSIDDQKELSLYLDALLHKKT